MIDPTIRDELILSIRKTIEYQARYIGLDVTMDDIIAVEEAGGITIILLQRYWTTTWDADNQPQRISHPAVWLDYISAIATPQPLDFDVIPSTLRGRLQIKYPFLIKIIYPDGSIKKDLPLNASIMQQLQEAL